MITPLINFIITNKVSVDSLKELTQYPILKNIFKYPEVFNYYFDSKEILYFIVNQNGEDKLIIPYHKSDNCILPSLVICNSLELFFNLEGKMYSSLNSFLLDSEADSLKGFLLSSLSSYSDTLVINYFKDYYGFEKGITKKFLYQNSIVSYEIDSINDLIKTYPTDSWAFSSLLFLNKGIILDNYKEDIAKDLYSLFKVNCYNKSTYRKIKQFTLINYLDNLNISLDSFLNNLNALTKPFKIINCTQRLYDFLNKTLSNLNLLLVDNTFDESSSMFFRHIKFLNIEQISQQQNFFNYHENSLISDLDLLKKEVVLEKKLLKLLNDNHFQRNS